jgi:hypothetical protein
LDDKGEFADFHALRNPFATMLTLAEVSQRVIMELNGFTHSCESGRRFARKITVAKSERV